MKIRVFSVEIGLLILVWAASANAQTPDPECVKWFQRSKIEAGTSDCEILCSSLTVDMGTFQCPNQCRLLCKRKDESALLGRFVYYPGLTPSELKLAEANPKDAVIVFIQKTYAEMSSNKNFPTQKINDEGDAFRHFMWAGLLTKELGEEKAKSFLDAHEDNRLQPPEEKAMDFANNRAGILAAIRLLKEGSCSQDRLERVALEEMREGHLSVLNPGLPIPKEPQ